MAGPQAEEDEAIVGQETRAQVGIREIPGLDDPGPLTGGGSTACLALSAMNDSWTRSWTN